MKGYMEYEKPWWQSTDIAGHCFTNPSPFRKIYFPRHAPYLLIYSDGENALTLEKLLGDDDRVLASFEAAVRDAISFDGLGGPIIRPTKQVWRFWQRGISFWKGGLRLLPNNFWSYAPNIHVCSDLYTDHVGWVEGGVVSAEAAANRVADLLQQQAPTTRSVQLECSAL
jgi:monoamine oxidase